MPGPEEIPEDKYQAETEEEYEADKIRGRARELETDTRARQIAAREDGWKRSAGERYQPTKYLQTPEESVAAEPKKYLFAQYLVPQECAYILWAISIGSHAVTDIVETVKGTVPDIRMSDSICRDRLKSMALTGTLVIRVQPLPQNRYRLLFFLIHDADGELGAESNRHLLTIEEHNSRVADGDAEEIKWIKPVKRNRRNPLGVPSVAARGPRNDT